MTRLYASVTTAVSFVLSTVAGHLFGYEAALSIDSQARPLRETRAAVEQAVSEHPDMTGLDDVGTAPREHSSDQHHHQLLHQPSGSVLNQVR